MIVIAQTLAAVFKLTDQYTTTMQKIIQSSDAYEKKQQEAQKVTEKFKASVSGFQNTSASAAGGLNLVTAKITGLVSAAYMGKKAIDLMFTAIKTGASNQVQLNTFQSLLGSANAGTALNDYIKAYAKKSALGYTDLASSTTSFLGFTKNVDQIEQLNKLVERLYAKNPEQGASGAVFALKEILTGQTQSIKDRFNMNGISADKITKLTQAGDIEGTINYLDEIFNKFGATQGIVTANFDSLLMGFNRFKSNFIQGMSDEANPAVQNLSLVMKQLNADMDAGKFQPFFTLMANGAAAIGNGLAWVAQNANFLIPVIGGVVSAIVIFNTAMNLAKMYTMATGIMISAVAGNWITAAALIAGAAATIGLSATLNKQNDSIKQSAKSLTDAKAAAAKAMTGTVAATKVPVEVANTSPISVKGNVEIEKESQKYLFDLAAQKAFATFNMQQVTPQVIIQNQNVSKVADLEEINQSLGDVVYQNQQSQASGVYA